MKRYDLLSTSMLAILCVTMLSGCATNAVFPDSSASSLDTAVSMPSLHTSVYGGHAPIVGAHVFLLQASTNGYGNQATSLLPSVATPANGSGGGQVRVETSTLYGTQGMGYVVTDQYGDGNVSGEYTCQAGLPVYLYTTGGTSEVSPNTPITSGSFTTTSATFVAPNNLVSIGQQVTIQNVIGSNLAGDADATSIAGGNLVGGTYTVTAASLNSFTISLPNNFTFLNAGNNGNTTGGTVAVASPSNPAVGEMAMLGLCPSGVSTANENFSNLSTIYVNEVSTVATAYAMGGFMSPSCTSTNKNSSGNFTTAAAATCMSIPGEGGNPLSSSYVATNPSPAWYGLQNATRNAAQIYNIGGFNGQTNPANGEGHIANSSIYDGNGNLVATISQALVHGIANSLATCVDSGNTASPPNVAQCSDLLTKWALPTASGAGGAANGSKTPTMSGTAPPETASAAINLAHNPWNPDYTNILTKDVNEASPYLPTVTSAQDLAVTISYPMTNAQSGGDGGIAIDMQGNAWVSGFSSGVVTKLSPQGAILWQDTTLRNSTLQSGGLFPGMIGIDSHGDGWVSVRTTTNFSTFLSGVYKYSATNASAPQHFAYQSSVSQAQGSDPSTQGFYDSIWVSVDGNDNAYFTNHVFNNTMTMSTAGVIGTSYSDGANPGYAVTNGSNSPPKGATAVSSSTYDGPFANAFDASGNLWETINQGQFNSIVLFAKGGSSSLAPTAIWGTKFPIQGNGNPTTSGGKTVHDPTGLAVDNSGNVWVASAGTNDGFFTINASSGAVITDSNYDSDSSRLYQIFPSSGSNTQSGFGITSYSGASYGLLDSVGVAVDGNGLVFLSCPIGEATSPAVANGDIAVFNSKTSNFISGPNGLTGTNSVATPMKAPYFMAVDNSGDLWVNTNTTVVEYLGLATPVLTPISANLKGSGPASKP